MDGIKQLNTYIHMPLNHLAIVYRTRSRNRAPVYNIMLRTHTPGYKLIQLLKETAPDNEYVPVSQSVFLFIPT
jgi:hypothetical protein